MYRRDFLLGSPFLVVGLTTGLPLYSESAGTVFNIIWRDLNIGYSKANLTKKKNQLIFNAEVYISVTLLGINIFTYSLLNEEIWENKILQSLQSRVLIGKKEEFCRGFRTKNGFMIEGSSYKGLLEGNPATTSYFTTDFLKRKIWISTQNGKPLNIKSTNLGEKKIITPVEKIIATEWAITGDLNIYLYYDTNGQWVGSKFKAGGSNAQFNIHKSIGNLNSIWSQT
jgi:hypothetical protein